MSRRRSRSTSRGSTGSLSRSSRSNRSSSRGAGDPQPEPTLKAGPVLRAPDGTTYSDLRDLAVGIAQQAAGLVRRMRAEGVSVAATKSSDIDIVTEADRASERLVLDLLTRLRPDDAVVGEEGADRPGTSGVRWVVDPIDGTVNFLYGIAQYAVSIAAVCDDADGQPQRAAAAVVNVATGDTYEAFLGGGARQDNVPLRVRPAAPLAHRLVRTGFSYDAELRGVQAQAVAALLPQVRDIRRMGSCALDLCAIAAGDSDAYVEEGTNPWDYAAGALIATESGARFEISTGVGGRPLVLCAPADGFDEIAHAITEAGFTDRPTQSAAEEIGREIGGEVGGEAGGEVGGEAGGEAGPRAAESAPVVAEPASSAAVPTADEPAE